MDTNPGIGQEGARDDAAQGSEEEARKFVEQLRSTPAEQILAEVFSTLLTAAEVKLGRRDARLFIDLCAALSERAGRYLPDELGRQVEKVLGQLRMGQVNAENHRSGQSEPEPNDLSRNPTPRAPASDPAPTQAPTGGGPTVSPASRLWVPGR